MESIKIHPAVLVPDDKTYCKIELKFPGERYECKKLKCTEDNKPLCAQFDIILEIHVDDQEPFPVKCDECKAAYFDAKHNRRPNG